MAEFSAGLQTRQEERYVILLFLLLQGGSLNEFFMTIALAIPPLTVKNRGGGGALIRDRALNRANTVRHNFHIQCHGNSFKVKNIYYMI